LVLVGQTESEILRQEKSPIDNVNYQSGMSVYPAKAECSAKDARYTTPHLTPFRFANQVVSTF
jgi:hypothetical protein